MDGGIGGDGESVDHFAHTISPGIECEGVGHVVNAVGRVGGESTQAHWGVTRPEAHVPAVGGG